MPIRYISATKTFKLDTSSSTYAFRVAEGGYLEHLYYGAFVPDEDFSALSIRGRCDVFHATDADVYRSGLKWFSPDLMGEEYAPFGTGDMRTTAIRVKNADGNEATDLRYAAHRFPAAKPGLCGLPALREEPGDGASLEVELSDAVTGLTVTLRYTVYKAAGAITRSAHIENRSARPFSLENAKSFSVDFPTCDYELIHLWGRWGKERSVERRPLMHGIETVSSVRGSSSHQHNPFLALAAPAATEQTGECYGFSLLYSGSHDCSVEVDGFGSTRVLMGIHDVGFSWEVKPGDTFDTPEAILLYTKDGIGDMSRRFHRLFRERLLPPAWKTARRPVLINSWEGAGFDICEEKLVRFAEKAGELGFDMLVMDDGWFGHRNDSSSSLGDWYVNPQKLPDGLGALIEKVRAKGLAFGIWFEPEMVSPDSDLYRAHPDWCLHVPGRVGALARGQYVLDFSREDVRDAIYERVSSILRDYDISYLKWDFNRNLTDVGSAMLDSAHQGEVLHRYVLGVYAFMDRMTREFPDLLFENCSGGGGRFDGGMLAFSPQIWTSDNCDPIERLSIQFGTSLCYPPSAMACHVSASPRTGYETKGNVAMFGSFGYELDPNVLSDEVCATIRRQLENWERRRTLVTEGDLYRLIDPLTDAFRCAWEQVSEDRSRAMLTVVTMRKPSCPRFYLRFAGLDPDRRYRLSSDAGLYDGAEFSGAYLQNVGLNLTALPAEDGDSYVFECTAV